ncbi:MAG: hypothetical protein IJN08_05660, partial [Clostridia bacterium]|nr:hypothetical protein [Clostridia bacterium]
MISSIKRKRKDRGKIYIIKSKRRCAYQKAAQWERLFAWGEDGTLIIGMKGERRAYLCGGVTQTT